MKNIIHSAIISLFLCACTNGNGKSFIPERPKTAAELRAELKSKEEDNAAQYLDAGTLQWRKDTKVVETHLLWPDERGPDGITITGTIKNTASVAKFKDIRIKVSWISETQTEISSSDFVIYKEVDPGKSVSFSFKTYPPDAMRNLTYTILGASPVLR